MKTTAKTTQRTSAKEVFEALLKEMKVQALSVQTTYYTRLLKSVTDVMPADKGISGDDIKTVFDPTYKTQQRWGKQTPQKYYVVTKFMTCGEWPEYLYTVKPNVEKLIATQAAHDVDLMFASFIAKQTNKTDAIIKGRGLKVDGHVSGSLECELFFTLADGASFRMKTQIVYKCNRYGTNFWQFPTTFHDATDANGQEISRPSEAKLKASL